MLRRPVSVVGAERPSRLCVLITQSCRARSIGTKPAKYLKILLLQPETMPNCFGATHYEIFPRASEPNGIETRQFTNRRMRTFIATPSDRNVNSTEDPP